MKKIVFTAMAVLAFSAVAIAENRVKESVEKVANKKVVFLTDCTLAKFVAYNDARAAGFSREDALDISYSVYFTCMALPQPPSEQQ